MAAVLPRGMGMEQSFLVAATGSSSLISFSVSCPCTIFYSNTYMPFVCVYTLSYRRNYSGCFLSVCTSLNLVCLLFVCLFVFTVQTTSSLSCL